MGSAAFLGKGGDGRWDGGEVEVEVEVKVEVVGSKGMG